MFGNVELVDNELYYFDEVAANRAIDKTIEPHLIHYEGVHKGKRFLLLPWQKTLLRTIFGWKRRSDNLRRFRTIYLISGKGAGKTPLLSACGIHCLVNDKEASPHVISMASTSEQAHYTFDAAKNYIALSKRLSEFAIPRQYEIRGAKNNGKWTLISGQPKGRSGSKPSMIIADELHEWSAATANAFELLTANCFKRAQPIIFMATNAGADRNSFAWQVHERAMKIRDGDIQDDTFLPVIFEAPEELEWSSEEAARAANPSIPEVIKFDSLAPAIAKAKESSVEELKYRRLNLSQWPKTTIGRWLDMPLWEAACVEKVVTKPHGIIELGVNERVVIPTDAVLYPGLDMSLNNDLSAAVMLYATAEKMYVKSHFWIPRWRAEEDLLRHRVDYVGWEKGGHVNLVDKPTIDATTRLEIANYIVAEGKAHKVKAVCYDRAKAEQVVATLEVAGVVCVPVAQGWTLTPGCEELDRRLQEGSIVIENNPCLTFCAQNAQKEQDRKGNYWPAKPNATASSVGLRWMKIDGITALVTAATEARKHSFPRKRPMVRATII